MQIEIEVGNKTWMLRGGDRCVELCESRNVTNKDTGETRTQVMINRKTFSAGDTLSITNLSIHFVWRLDTVAERDLKLTPVKATRISAKPSEALK